MSQVGSDFDYTKLSVAERIILVQEIWDSIAEDTVACELTEVQRKELARRAEEMRRDPEMGIPWQEVKARVLSERHADKS